MTHSTNYRSFCPPSQSHDSCKNPVFLANHLARTTKQKIKQQPNYSITQVEVVHCSVQMSHVRYSAEK